MQCQLETAISGSVILRRFRKPIVVIPGETRIAFLESYPDR